VMCRNEASERTIRLRQAGRATPVYGMDQRAYKDALFGMARGNEAQFVLVPGPAEFVHADAAWTAAVEQVEAMEAATEIIAAGGEVYFETGLLEPRAIGSLDLKRAHIRIAQQVEQLRMLTLDLARAYEFPVLARPEGERHAVELGIVIGEDFAPLDTRHHGVIPPILRLGLRCKGRDPDACQCRDRKKLS